MGPPEVFGMLCDEDSGRASARLLVAIAFGHLQPPSQLCGIVMDAFGVGNLGEFCVGGRPVWGSQFDGLDACFWRGAAVPS
jgi:hypothetical protein